MPRAQLRAAYVARAEVGCGASLAAARRARSLPRYAGGGRAPASARGGDRDGVTDGGASLGPGPCDRCVRGARAGQPGGRDTIGASCCRCCRPLRGLPELQRASQSDGRPAFAALDLREEARASAESATAVAGTFDSSAWRAMAESAAGSAAKAEGESARARAHFEAAASLYERAHQPFWAERSRAQLAAA